MIYNNLNIVPRRVYTNIYKEKYLIYKENRNKSGIYKFTNLITGEYYIGSSVSLTRRFGVYFCLSYLYKNKEKSSSLIYESILKYGYSEFSLEILEYCEPNILIEREQYYINFLKPKYNICKIAGSRLGIKRSKKIFKNL
jgi:group I intron endonuclease